MDAAAAKSLQSCPTLCDPIDGSPQGSPVPGILRARTLEWVAISFSNAWKLKVKVKSLSRVRLLATPWAAAHQAPQSMWVSRQEYWSGVPLPSPKWRLDVAKGSSQTSPGLYITIRTKKEYRKSPTVQKHQPSGTQPSLWSSCDIPTCLNLSLNLTKRSSWSELQLTPGLVFTDCIELLPLRLFPDS